MRRQNSNGTSNRRQMDFVKLASNPKYEVTATDSVHEFFVTLSGPPGTAYEGGVWAIRILLPGEYPYKSPSIGFANRIYHPNIDEASGSVCLDVINQTWSPMYELSNIIDVFLPQLLRYPNPTDPLNPEAASLLINDPTAYTSRVQDHVCRFGTRKLATDAIQKVLGCGHAMNDSPQTDASKGLTGSAPSSLEPSGDDEEYNPGDIEL